MEFEKKKIKNDKIELMCYYGLNGISYTYNKDLNRFYLLKPLNFIPYDLGYNEDEIKHLVDVCLTSPALKITIERI